MDTRGAREKKYNSIYDLYNLRNDPATLQKYLRDTQRTMKSALVLTFQSAASSFIDLQSGKSLDSQPAAFVPPAVSSVGQTAHQSRRSSE